MNAVQLVQVRAPLAKIELPKPSVSGSDVLVRVRAAGICHSDAHYRSGESFAGPLPITLGHEIAGIVEECGENVANFRKGDRVCVHYLATCGSCKYCVKGIEQFCTSGQMFGKHRHGGFADFVLVPQRSLVPLPDSISFPEGAVMMCSAATSLHALNKSRLRQGESVAIFGVGGLGFAAVQLAIALGAGLVYAVDIHESKLKLAANCGAIPIDARDGNPAQTLMRMRGGAGVDVAIELVGSPITSRQAILSLGVQGRAVIAGITSKSFELYPYAELLNKEAEIIGVSDHLAAELPALMSLVSAKKLNLAAGIARPVPLDAVAINMVLDELDHFGETVRSVVVP